MIFHLETSWSITRCPFYGDCYVLLWACAIRLIFLKFLGNSLLSQSVYRLEPPGYKVAGETKEVNSCKMTRDAYGTILVRGDAVFGHSYTR